MPRALGKRDAVVNPLIPHLRLMDRHPEAPPEPINWYADIGEWPMLRNDVLGCCVPAAALHCIQQRLAYAGKPFEPSDALTEAVYSQWAGWNPADPLTDQGTLMSEALAKWARDGITLPDGTVDKPDAVASINQITLGWLRYAIWRCGAVLIGLNCPTAWLEEELYLLDVPAASEEDIAIAGGHCMLLVGCEQTALGYEFDSITWGSRCRTTWRALSMLADEAYAILNRDWVDVSGMDPAGIEWAMAEEAMGRLRSG
jgi:hypothetical protein